MFETVMDEEYGVGKTTTKDRQDKKKKKKKKGHMEGPPTIAIILGLSPYNEKDKKNANSRR
jgi:hypothetical protein